MKKLINAPGDVIAESLAGFAAAHGETIVLDAERRFVRRRHLVPGKVAVVSGGGSGHEPLHVGFVGTGMLDAACPGQIFTSPTPDQILAAVAAVDGGAGTVLVVKNYAGDVMNFEMAAELAEGRAGERIEAVVVDDDVAVEASAASGRRGVAGTLVVEKIVGAAAEAGRDLATVVAIGRRANAATRSIGVALSSCTVPQAGRPTFSLGEDEMEFGVGIHGEPGRRRVPLAAAAAIAEEMAAAVTAELGPQVEDDALLFVNGFGGTPAIELYLMYEALRLRLADRGWRVTRSLVGPYVTSLEMAGCSMTLTRLDPELKALWDAPVATPALRRGM